jgi:hypothetical protein
MFARPTSLLWRGDSHLISLDVAVRPSRTAVVVAGVSSPRASAAITRRCGRATAMDLSQSGGVPGNRMAERLRATQTFDEGRRFGR